MKKVIRSTCFVLMGTLIVGCTNDVDKSTKKSSEHSKLEYSVKNSIDVIPDHLINNQINFVLSPQFDQVGKFVDGIMSVEKEIDGVMLKGFMNDEGEVLVQPKFQDTKFYLGMSSGSAGFSEGLAPVKNENKWGYINLQGEKVIDYLYDDAQLFKGNRAVVEVEGKYGLINDQGEWVIPPTLNQLHYQFGVGIVESEGEWGFIDKNGNWLQQPIYDYIDLFRNEHSSKQFVVVVENQLEGLVELNDGKIKSILLPKYTRIFPYQKDKAAYLILPRDDNGNYTNKKSFGYIDDRGNEIFRWDKFEFEFGQLSEDRIAVQNEAGKWGFIDLEKQLVVPYRFDNVTSFYDGNSLVTVDGKVGMIDLTGNLVLEPTYTNIVPMDTYFIIEDDQGEFLVDRTNLKQISKAYDDIGRGGQLKPFKLDKMIGFVDEKGNEVVSPQYDECKYFTFWDGYAAVRNGDRWFYINERGEKIGNHTFEDVKLFEGEFAAVKNNGKWGVVNRKLEIIVPLIFDEIILHQEGIIQVLEDGKYGFIKL